MSGPPDIMPSSGNGRALALYTSPVTADEITGQVAHTTHLFQQRIPKRFEVRLTMVDDQLFGVRIDSHTAAARHDWRADHDNITWTAIDVPAAVAAAVHRLMTSYGLVFGALDFIVDPDDRWWFLEINPNGQWAWDHPQRDAITDALATALTRPAPSQPASERNPS